MSPVLSLGVLCLSTPSDALLGIGAHKGIDFSISMDDAESPFELSGVTLMLPRSQAEGGDTVLDSSANYSFTRSNWERTVMNFGGKVYVDVIPIIDALEFSCNFGIWQYEANFSYPLYNYSTRTVSQQTRKISLDSLGIQSKWGVHEIPYVKFHGDITIRKYVVRVPRDLKVLNLYAGGGFNFFMATPILTIDKVRPEVEAIVPARQYSMLNPNDTAAIRGENALVNAVNDVMQGLTNRQGGIHFTAGIQIQVPVVPLSLYADAKFLIPFAELDEAAQIGGYGFVLNAGVALSVSSEMTKHTEGFE
jgi:hypothetical protein